MTEAKAIDREPGEQTLRPGSQLSFLGIIRKHPDDVNSVQIYIYFLFLLLTSPKKWFDFIVYMHILRSNEGRGLERVMERKRVFWRKAGEWMEA